MNDSKLRKYNLARKISPCFLHISVFLPFLLSAFLSRMQQAAFPVSVLLPQMAEDCSLKDCSSTKGRPTVSPAGWGN